MKNLILTISILFLGIQTFAQAPIISVAPDSLSETLFIVRLPLNHSLFQTTGIVILIFNIATEFFPSGNYQNYALQFDGVDDMVEGPSTGFPVGNSDRTIELWFKRISQPVCGGYLYLMGIGAIGTSLMHFQLEMIE